MGTTDYWRANVDATLHVLEGMPHKVEKKFTGAELVGLHYETFFPDVANQPQIEHRVVAWRLDAG